MLISARSKALYLTPKTKWLLLTAPESCDYGVCAVNVMIVGIESDDLFAALKI